MKRSDDLIDFCITLLVAAVTLAFVSIIIASAIAGIVLTVQQFL